MSNNLYKASHQWATRPNDQRFLNLEDLLASVSQRKRESWTATPKVKTIRPVIETVDNDERLMIQVFDPSEGGDRLLEPTHHGFGQLAQYAGAPASYLRKLPDALAAINLAFGLENQPIREDALLLAQSNGENHLRAITSTSYGRIWDEEVVRAVIKVNGDGRWRVPASSYTVQNPKRATTLYASDRDVFIFLVDDQNPIEVNGETLFRGFMTWNSEVGSAVFGLTTFLYRYVCDNRIIWGATEVQELRIRHTGGAPERFAYEGAQYLSRYAEESTYKTVQAISAAQQFEIPKAAKKDGVLGWLKERGFTAAVAKAAVQSAEVEEGEAKSLWQIINGLTAHARTIPHTDARVELETSAGKLMKYVTN
jgi:hypothetical protein